MWRQTLLQRNVDVSEEPDDSGGTGPSESPVTVDQTKKHHIPEYCNLAVRAHFKIWNLTYNIKVKTN